MILSGSEHGHPDFEQALTAGKVSRKFLPISGLGLRPASPNQGDWRIDQSIRDSPESSTTIHLSPSSRGLGHRPFTAVTGVRIPLGTPYKTERPALCGSICFDRCQAIGGNPGSNRGQ